MKWWFKHTPRQAPVTSLWGLALALCTTSQIPLMWLWGDQSALIPKLERINRQVVPWGKLVYQSIDYSFSGHLLNTIVCTMDTKMGKIRLLREFRVLGGWRGRQLHTLWAMVKWKTSILQWLMGTVIVFPAMGCWGMSWVNYSKAPGI